MPRKRYLKPSFNDDNDIVALTDSARLLYALLWCHMDRNGVIEDSVLSIRSKIYPREDRPLADVSRWLGELMSPGPSGRPRIYRFNWRGRPYLYAPTMPRHQKIYGDEPPIIPVSAKELAAVVDDFEKVMISKDAAPQPGTCTGAGQVPSPNVSGEHLSTGGPPEQARAFSFPFPSNFSSASASPVQMAGGDKSVDRVENSEGNSVHAVIRSVIAKGSIFTALDLISKLPERDQVEFEDFLTKHAGLGRAAPEGTA